MSPADSALKGWRAFLALLLLAYASTRAQARCDPYPVALRVGNISLSNGKVARGVEMTVGEPEQNFAFMPQFDRNSILLYSSETLQQYRSRSEDITYRGGYYDPIASRTRKASTLDTSLGDPADPKVSPIADVMRLNENTTLEDMQMGIAHSDWEAQIWKPQMSFGLGTNSTMLRVLRASKRIASRSWGFFWGFGFGMPSQLDGNFVFGGYDRAKVTGKRYTAKFTPNEPECETQMVVDVSDLTLNFPNGTDVSIFPKSSPRPVIRTCIVPFVPVLMAMPLKPYFNNWMIETKHDIAHMETSRGYYWWNQMYKSKDIPYLGGLTISLSSGLNITVSNEKLLVPDVYISPANGETLGDRSKQVLLVASLQGSSANDMPYLGSQFLAAAYLQVNQDAGQFSLWKANPTTNEDLVAVNDADAEVAEFCEVVTNATAPNTTAPRGTVPDTVKASLSKGVIAGIIVGAAAGVAVVVGFTTWLFKKRRMAAAAKEQEMVSELPGCPYEPKRDSTQQHTSPVVVQETGSTQEDKTPAVRELNRESPCELA